MDLIQFDKQVLQLLYGAVVSIISKCGLIIEVRCRNQSSKTKLVLYKPLLSL